MAKLLGEKAVFNRLQKFVDENFTEEEQEYMEWYNDIEGETTHAWKFDHEGRTHVLEIDKRTKKIDHRILQRN